MKKLALCLMLVFATGCSKGEEATDAAADAAAGAADAAKGAAGDVLESASDMMGSKAGDIKEAGMMKLAQLKTQMFEKTVGVLSGITNVETAKSALPQLQDVAANVGAMKERLADIGGSVGATSGDHMNALSEQVQRIEGISGVKDVIGKPLNTILSFFRG